MKRGLQQTKKADFNGIAKKYNISPITARLMRNRDVISEKEINQYLNGTINEISSPWLFKDMDKAVNILSIRINNESKIRIICDYGCQMAICSGYILHTCLKYLGADVDVVVPHRIEDGYGINGKINTTGIRPGC